MSVPIPDNGYPLLAGDTSLTFWQAILDNLHGRLLAAEAVRASFEAMEAEGVSESLARMANAIAPQMADLQAELLAMRTAIDIAESQLLALQNGGVLAANVPLANIPGSIFLDNSNVQQAMALISDEIRRVDLSIGNRIPNTARGVAGGVATLDGGGKIPFAQLPDVALSQVGDVITTQRAVDPAKFLQMNNRKYLKAAWPELATVVREPLVMTRDALTHGGASWYAPMSIGVGATTVAYVSYSDGTCYAHRLNKAGGGAVRFAIGVWAPYSIIWHVDRYYVFGSSGVVVTFGETGTTYQTVTHNMGTDGLGYACVIDGIWYVCSTNVGGKVWRGASLASMTQVLVAGGVYIGSAPIKTADGRIVVSGFNVIGNGGLQSLWVSANSGLSFGALALSLPIGGGPSTLASGAVWLAAMGDAILLMTTSGVYKIRDDGSGSDRIVDAVFGPSDAFTPFRGRLFAGSYTIDEELRLVSRVGVTGLAFSVSWTSRPGADGRLYDLSVTTFGIIDLAYNPTTEFWLRDIPPLDGVSRHFIKAAR